MKDSKKCTKCGEAKPLSEYHRNKYFGSGYSARCKKCVNAAQKKPNISAARKKREKERLVERITCLKCSAVMIAGVNTSKAVLSSGNRVCHDCKGMKVKRVGTNPNPNCNRCGVALVRGENILESQFKRSNFKCKDCRSLEGKEYRQTPQGKASAERINAKPETKVRKAAWMKTPKGRISARRNAKKAYHKNKKHDPKYWEYRQAYRQSEAGKASGKKTKKKQVLSGAAAAAAQRYKNRKFRARPEWVNKSHIVEMEAMHTYHAIFHAVMPEKSWHVDHIVPLNNKGAKGLDVPWNLQVIPASENSRKGTKLPPVSERIAYEKHLLQGIATR